MYTKNDPVRRPHGPPPNGLGSSRKRGVRNIHTPPHLQGERDPPATHTEGGGNPYPFGGGVLQGWIIHLIYIYICITVKVFDCLIAHVR